jgi:hypothetical protein
MHWHRSHEGNHSKSCALQRNLLASLGRACFQVRASTSDNDLLVGVAIDLSALVVRLNTAYSSNVQLINIFIDRMTGL